MKTLKAVTQEVLKLIPEIPGSATEMVEQVQSPSRLVFLIASNLPSPPRRKIRSVDDDVAAAMRTP
jgi:hypothetical protein